MGGFRVSGGRLVLEPRGLLESCLWWRVAMSSRSSRRRGSGTGSVAPNCAWYSDSGSGSDERARETDGDDRGYLSGGAAQTGTEGPSETAEEATRRGGEGQGTSRPAGNPSDGYVDGRYGGDPFVGVVRSRSCPGDGGGRVCCGWSYCGTR